MKQPLDQPAGFPGNEVEHAPNVNAVQVFLLRKLSPVSIPNPPVRIVGKCRDHLHAVALGGEVFAQSGGEGRDGGALRVVVNSKNQDSHGFGNPWDWRLAGKNWLLRDSTRTVRCGLANPACFCEFLLDPGVSHSAVSYTHLRAHETGRN